MPVALLPDSAAPFTAPVAAPTAAPVKTVFTTSFARVRMPFDERERFVPAFLVVLFLPALLFLVVPALRATLRCLEAFVVLLLAVRAGALFFADFLAADFLAVDFLAVDFLALLEPAFLEPDLFTAFLVAILLAPPLLEPLQTLRASAKTKRHFAAAVASQASGNVIVTFGP